MVKIERCWAMPNKHTFLIKPIRQLLFEEATGDIILDPFSSNNSEFSTITNDLNPKTSAQYHLDALEFLKLFENESVDTVLYDPPYSPRQVSECYKNFGISITSLETSGHWRASHLNEIARILKPNGKVISFGWNTNGAGKKRGFEIKRILIVAHGSSHNDTLVTVEIKKFI
ncbi:adenine-specific DNA methylase [Campylobacter jejuni]|nr:adenine-specific DNA methylase [Campylobacter jejuni]